MSASVCGLTGLRAQLHPGDAACSPDASPCSPSLLGGVCPCACAPDFTCIFLSVSPAGLRTIKARTTLSPGCRPRTALGLSSWEKSS